MNLNFDLNNLITFLEQEWQIEMRNRDPRNDINWKSPYEIKHYLDWLKRQPGTLFFGLKDGRGNFVAGASLLNDSIKDFIVRNGERGNGWGKKLIKLILKQVQKRPLYLQCDPSLESFYNSFGFRTYDKANERMLMKL